MFGTQKNKLIDSAIVYVAPKNNTMAHSMSLNSRISFVVGISIFGFNKYCQAVFYLMDIDMIPSFKQIFQSKTTNAEKNELYHH